jgi:hypothetical protein
MHITLKRTHYTKFGVFGVMSSPDIQDGAPFLLTLEDPDNHNKPGESCIPKGTYKVEPYNGTKYKGVYHVMNVPGRSAILIHWGNTHEDTRGCILVGSEYYSFAEDKPGIGGSMLAMNELRGIVGKQAFTLEII